LQGESLHGISFLVVLGDLLLTLVKEHLSHLATELLLHDDLLLLLLDPLRIQNMTLSNLDAVQLLIEVGNLERVFVKVLREILLVVDWLVIQLD
jgi:hypothetical protein